jgi:phage gp45-like
MSTFTALAQMIQPLARRVVGMLQRATLIRQADGGLQVWGTDGDLRDNVEHFGHIGIKVIPLPGTEAIVAAIGGDASHRVVLGTRAEESEPDVGEPGDVLIYHLVSRARIWLRQDGSIELVGDLRVDGDVSDRHGSLNDLRAIFNSHGHPPTAPGAPVPQMRS